MSPRRSWFWTPERLRRLVDILKKDIAKREGSSWYFGPEGLQMQAYLHLMEIRDELAQGNITDGISALVFLGVIARGEPSTKPADYRRPFYPDKVTEITQEGVDRFRAYKRRNL